MYNRLINKEKIPKSQSFFLLGPRGIGKTSWLKKCFPGALYFDLLHGETYTELLGNASLLEQRIPDGNDEWVIIDEVQKIPSLLNEVHRLIESKGYRFILTGSSARSLRRKGTNLLAGRALTFYMFPLTAEELGEDFRLDIALEYGMLPFVYQAENPRAYLQSYVTTYLKEEVQQEALTRNIALFTRFLATASFSQGEVLNYTEIGREIGTSRQSVMNYFDLLEDLLIAERLPVFTKRAKRQTISQPKFYYFDTGVYQILRPRGPLDTKDEISGAALETLFFQHIKALNSYYQKGYELFYWRTRSKVEVDFILYGESGLLAFEIKRKQKLTGKDFNGLNAFLEDYPMAQCYMLYGGTREYHQNNIRVVPFDHALQQLVGWL